MRHALASLALLLAAACSRAPASVADAVEAPAPDLVAPGRWRFTTSTPAISRPGYPTLSDGRVQTHDTFERCLPKAGSELLTPELLADAAASDHCRRDVWSVKDGSINAVLVCPGHAEDIREVPTTIHGAYTHASFWVQRDQSALGMTISTTLRAERTGDC